MDSRFVSRFGPAERSSLSPSRLVERQEDRARLRLALELQEPTDQCMVLMHQAQGLSFREISERMDLEVKTANKRYQRAVTRLGRTLRKLRANNLDGLATDLEMTRTEPAADND